MIILKNKDSIADLKKEIKKTKDEKYKTKLRAIIKIKEKNKKRKEIVNELVISFESLTSWVKKYNKEGKEGLKTNKGGRPKGSTNWDDKVFKKLTKEIDKSEQYWSLKLMREWLSENEKSDIPLTTIWYRVTQLGYSHKSSRPYPYKGNKEKQEKFKKGALKQKYRIFSSNTKQS